MSKGDRYMEYRNVIMITFTVVLLLLTACRQTFQYASNKPYLMTQWHKYQLLIPILIYPHSRVDNIKIKTIDNKRRIIVDILIMRDFKEIFNFYLNYYKDFARKNKLDFHVYKDVFISGITLRRTPKEKEVIFMILLFHKKTNKGYRIGIMSTLKESNK